MARGAREGARDRNETRGNERGRRGIDCACGGGQKPVRMWQPWHSADDMPSRRAVLRAIFGVFQRCPGLVDTEEWQRSFPDFLRRLELVLYLGATSREEYAECSTVPNRLREIARTLQTQRDSQIRSLASEIADTQTALPVELAPSPDTSITSTTGQPRGLDDLAAASPAAAVLATDGSAFVVRSARQQRNVVVGTSRFEPAIVELLGGVRGPGRTAAGPGLRLVQLVETGERQPLRRQQQRQPLQVRGAQGGSFPAGGGAPESLGVFEQVPLNYLASDMVDQECHQLWKSRSATIPPVSRQR